MNPYDPLDTKPSYVYGLFEPLTAECRYVGVSVSPKRRYYAHCSVKSRRHCSCWVQSVLALGLKPKMEILEVVPAGGDWATREGNWIQHYRQLQHRLTNHCEGGKSRRGFDDSTREKMRQAKLGNQNAKGHTGIWGYQHTKAAKAKISAAALGNQRGLGQTPTPARRLQMAARMKGNTNRRGMKTNPETCAKISAALKDKPGLVYTEELREKRRQQMLGNQANKGRLLSDEHKAKISASQKGRHLSEATKAKMRAAALARLARRNEPSV